MTTTTTEVDWPAQLADQLDGHWDLILRPRLEGLTDEEYLWEPVPGCWSLRPPGTSSAPVAAGAGELRIDFAFPEPDPPPVTTIAWRLGHILVGVLEMRIASHFGGPAVAYDTYEWPTSAAAALARLDAAKGAWSAGVRGLGPEGMARPCGPAEGPYADHPLAALVLHINREVIHHGAEICLLRDLYRASGGVVLADGDAS